MSGASNTKGKRRKYTARAIKKDFKRHKIAYLMAVPGLVMLILFHYLPLFGLGLAFVDYKPNRGIFGSRFVGLKYFKEYFSSMYFGRTVKNTVTLSVLQILFVFLGSILFALLLNEIKNSRFKRTIQTVTYLPNFISMVVVAGIIVDFCGTKGVLGTLVAGITGQTKNLLSIPAYWKPIYIISDLWQGLGTGAIVYIAALSAIDQTLYEAAVIDGAGRWQQTLHVTIPGILPTVTIMLILKIGSIMSVGYEKTILLYNPQIYETADIISSYVYRKGLLEGNYGFSTAVSLFNSVINTALLLTANAISKKTTENSLF